jgi:hypothetical protein
MADPKTLLLLIGCKASLILAIVASLVAWAGRRWPFGCSTWQRIGVAALLTLPLAACLLPSIQIPILPRSESVITVREGNRPVNWIEKSSHVDSDCDLGDSDLSSLYGDSDLTGLDEATRSNQAQPNPKSGRARSVVICATAVLALGGIVISLLSERVSTSTSGPRAVAESKLEHREAGPQYRRSDLAGNDSTRPSSAPVHDGVDECAGFVLSEPTFPVSFITTRLFN